MPAVGSPPAERLPGAPTAQKRGLRSLWPWPGIPWPLPLILLIGAVNFFWQLGSSSYFVDEVYSILASSNSLGGVIHAVRVSEFTPPTYYLFLHELIGRTGSQAEWLLRLPSALAGVALVGAVYWMARGFLDRRGALAAAGLCALSPLVLGYAQEVRAYVFAMLAVTLAVGATIRGARPRGGSTRMLWLGALAAVIALLLHYTSTLVILPLCAWLATRNAISRRARAALLGSCALAELLVAPLFLNTYRNVPNGVLGRAALVTWTHLAQVAETPFVGRSAVSLDALGILGVAVSVVSVVVVLVFPRASSRGRASASIREPRLLVALACLAPVMLLVGAFAGKSVLITRYSAVAAPFLITAVAGAVVILPRPGAVVLALAALVTAGAGVIVSHSPRGFYPATGPAVNYIRSHERRGQLIALSGSVATDVPFRYYAGRRLRPPPQYVTGASLPPHRAARNDRPVWVVAWLPGRSDSTRSVTRSASRSLGRLGYRAQRLRTFTTSGTLVLVLALPGPVTR